MVRNQGRVTRFVVMAVLQAARAQTLGLPRHSAYSWGLNRAIFYAAAKSGFRRTPRAAGEGPSGTTPPPELAVYRLGEDEAYRAPGTELLFAIGDETQTPDAFEKGVVSRFGTKQNFEAAWDEALRIMAAQSRATLESPRGFYEEVYRPRRDELSDAWTQKYSPPRKAK